MVRADRAGPLLRRPPLARARSEDPPAYGGDGGGRSGAVQGPGRRLGGRVVSAPAVLLTGVGKRYDIVSCFAGLTRTIAADASALAPAQYAAQVHAPVPPIGDPGYVPALERLCEQHGVGAVLPLTDLDIEVLARARADGRLPALVPSPEVAHSTFDKYEAHLLLKRLS